MKFKDRVNKCLDEENMAVRQYKQVMDIVRAEKGAAEEERFRKLIKDFEEGRVPFMEFYEEMAQPLDGITVYDMLKSRFRSKIPWCLGKVAQSLSKQSKPRVLDLGCGTAFESSFLAQDLKNKGISIIGYDNCPGMVRAARRRIAKQGIDNLEVRLGDMDSISEKAGFDMAMCINSLAEGEDFRCNGEDFVYNYLLSQRLDRIKSYLKKGGTFVAVIPAGERKNYAEYFEQTNRDRLHFAGFEDISSSRHRSTLKDGRHYHVFLQGKNPGA